MNILVVDQVFFPEKFRINMVVEDLVKMGHDVTVLTGFPNYPCGEFFEGYGPKIAYNPYYKGAKIVRVKMHPRHKGKFHLALNYFSFYYNANKWVKRHGASFDISYSCQLSPVFMSLPCVTLKKKFGIPFIINVQDLWPESFEYVMNIHNKFLLYPLKLISNKVYKNANYILCSSKKYINILTKRNISKSKMFYWPQFSDVAFDNNIEVNFDKNNNFIFAGNIGFAQGLDVVVDCAHYLRNHFDICFHLFGDGSAKSDLQKKCNELKLTNVIFHDSINEELLSAYIKKSTACILCLKNGYFSENILPAKLQMYMQCGSAIICTVKGEASDVIEEAKCGLICESNDFTSLASCVLNLIDGDMNTQELGKNGISYCAENFSRKKLMKFLNELICSFQK